MKVIILTFLTLFTVGCSKTENNITISQNTTEIVEEIVEENTTLISDEDLKKELYKLKKYENELINSTFLDLLIFTVNFANEDQSNYIHSYYLEKLNGEINKEISLDLYKEIEDRYLDFISNLQHIIKENDIKDVLLDINKFNSLVSMLDAEKRSTTNDIRNIFKDFRVYLKSQNENYNEIEDTIEEEYELSKEDYLREFKGIAKERFNSILNNDKDFDNYKEIKTLLNIMFQEEFSKIGFVY